MKKKKNLFAKIMAGIALFAIVVGIVGTGALVVVSSFTSSNESSYETQISSDELQDIMNALPQSETEVVVNSTGSSVEPVEEVESEQ